MLDGVPYPTYKLTDIHHEEHKVIEAKNYKQE